MKRLGRTLVVSLAAGSLVVMPVSAEKDLQSMNQQKTQAENEVSSLQTQIQGMLDNINDLEKGLISTGEAISKASLELTEAQALEAKQYDGMKLRIKYMYEEGGYTALDKLFTAGNITDLLNRAGYFEQVQSYDRRKMQEYQNTRIQIASLKTELEEQMAQIQDQRSQFERKKNELNAVLVTRQEEIKNLDITIQQTAEAVRQQAAAEQAAAQQALADTSGNSRQNTPQITTPSGGQSSNTEPSKPEGNAPTPETPQAPAPEPIPQEPAPAPDPTPAPQPKPEPSPPSNDDYSIGQTIVAAARSQLGVPYVWGGNNPGVGLDCSGLTQYAYSVAGISIPRVSGDQLSNGTIVDDPIPGDICWTPGHVAIYIGSGQMIEAPDVGQVVKVSKVRATYYVRYR